MPSYLTCAEALRGRVFARAQAEGLSLDGNAMKWFSWDICVRYFRLHLRFPCNLLFLFGLVWSSVSPSVKAIASLAFSHLRVFGL